MPRIRRGEDRGRAELGPGHRQGHVRAIAASLAIFALAVGAGVGFGTASASGDESPSAPEPAAGVPTARQTREMLESSGVRSQEQGVETDPQAAEELPHRELGRGEALELVEGVFGAALEGPAGIYDELEPKKFLSDNAAVVPAPAPPEGAGGEAGAGGSTGGIRPGQPVLVESTLPLRTENAEGQVEPVDLTLESPEGSGGELQPRNPLTELAIPAHLEEGIAVGGIGIEVVGAAGETAPTNVEEQVAFYPNVARNTDLVVAPTPTGVETMTAIRSAEAPQTTTYRLSLPPGATLESDRDGGAEVVEDGKAGVVVLPPTATDAAGEAVPVVMQVNGDELEVSVSPEPSTSYPILVDPWYEVEGWNWTWGGSGFAGWTGSTNTSSYEPLSFARWDPAHFPGLDLTSGYGLPAWSGTHADWSYWVPRYAQDIKKYGSPPSTWITWMRAEGVLFVPWGHSENWPALVIGLVDPAIGWAGLPGFWVHYGGEGEINNWPTVDLFNSYENAPQNVAVKGADMNLVTYEYEPEAKTRDTFIGAATMYVGDVDAPKILELTAPEGWVTGPSARLGYGFEDTGLGVRAAGVRTSPAETAFKPGWTADYACVGTNASPCPRRVTSGEAGAVPLAFVPDELPTGEDELEVALGDPLWEGGKEAAHTATQDVTVKVDNTAPEVSLSGPLVEDGLATPQDPLPHEPVAAWSFDEGEGTVAHDATGHGHEGTVEGEAHWVSGRFGDALRFRYGQSHQCVTVPDSSELHLGKGFTVEAWVKPEGQSEGSYPLIFKEAGPGEGNEYALGIGMTQAGRVEGWAEWESIYSPQPLEEDAWSHVALTYDGQTLRLFVDGRPVSESAIGAVELESGGPLMIGCDGSQLGSAQFEGKIDEVRLYGRPLGEGEIEEDEVTPLPSPKPPSLPVAAWSFDEGEGTVAHDATGDGNEGTVEGAHWTTGKFDGALEFEGGGSGQCVTVPDSPSLQLSQEFTLEAWVKPESSGSYDPVIWKESEPGSVDSYALGIGFSQADRVEGKNEWEDVTSPEPVEEGAWTPIAYTFDGQAQRIFVDGKMVARRVIGSQELGSTGPLLIGCGGASGGQFEGKIDEVKIYDRALGEREIVADEGPERPVSKDSLEISAYDGTPGDPQSGVKKVEVKVDGTEVAMPHEEAWEPGCTTENCALQRTWTMDPAEYTPGEHEVEVLATDALGNVSSTTLEVEFGGEAPPQTSFTSPHPSFENHEIQTIGFKATREGRPVEGATFKCSFDGATATACSSPYTLPDHFTDGPHTFTVAAVDEGGEADPTPATWRFDTGPYPAAPQSEKMVYPEVGKKTAGYYTLEAEWGPNPEGKAGAGVTGVTFQMELPGAKVFKTVPPGCTIDGKGRQVSWPLPVHSNPGHDAPVYLRVRGCPAFEEAGYPEKEIQFRAVFDGGEKVAGASAPVATEFVSRYNANRVSTDATESVGPATVDLLTGSLTLSRTDVSIPVPGYEANLEFTRTFSSTIDKSLPGFSLVMGGAWQPASPLESEAEEEAWTRVEEKVIPAHPAVYGDECWEEPIQKVGEEDGEPIEEPVPVEIACPKKEECTIANCEVWEEEAAQPREAWIELIDNEGASIPFEIAGNGAYVAPEYAKELSLRGEGGNIVLAYPNGTHTIFTGGGEWSATHGRTWMPRYISYQANAQSMRMVYETEAGGKGQRLAAEIAPSPVTCPDEAQHTASCRMLKFNYSNGAFEEGGSFFCWVEWNNGQPRGEMCPTVLRSIEYFGPSGSGIGQKVATYKYEDIPKGFTGKAESVLASETDPRTGLTEKYTYEESSYRLSSLTPPGQIPWEFSYLPPDDSAVGSTRKLKSVSRGGATTTLAYEVPVTGTGAPYDMGPESISRWGEADLPVDATAIFPPNHVPSEYPPREYEGATIQYMDPEGYEVNTASPSPPGVAGASISTTETDVHGNVLRELDPQNRLAALAAPEPVARSHELDTHSVYNKAGTELLESWGPLHEVRLESGEVVQARQHAVTRYDEGAPPPEPGTPPAYLPTKETVSAVVPGREAELEPQVTQTKYNWPLRKPEETIVDPGGLDIRSITKYNGAGQVEETRQPKGAAGGTAGDTRTIYWSATGSGECLGAPQYANLPCKVLPAAQASGTGRPQLLVKKFLAYDSLGEPEQMTEAPANAPAEVRTTTTTYDAAGRQTSTKILGGGTALARTEAKTETVYDPTTGAPVRQQFVCQKECTGFDDQATTTTYNSLGQVTAYEDADGDKTETTYDAYGRPVTITDGKGTETLHYDETSGVLTSMEVSGVGTFTATYDADGDLVERGLPDGLTAKTTYDQAGEPSRLAYTKTSSCGESCTWYEETLERSIEGRILNDMSSLVDDRYSYDKAGRLGEAQETPTGGECTSRAYTYDADSNRLTKTTRSPGVGGTCAASGGAPQKYEYDEADRLVGPTYDTWGRITSLPAEFTGGKALTTDYFANDMVATQSQNGVTNTFQLDATGRQRQREQTGGVAGVEIFHYDGPGDSPAWTSLGSTWSRNVVGIGGELAAIQESVGTTTFELTDLHGDVVASASSSPAATKLLATSRFSEFGEPLSGSAGRFGWLGGRTRRTELSSGVIQMGARSYVPQLGRFLTPDSMPGGSANAYDYADQDPVNAFDLGGTCAQAKWHVTGHCSGKGAGHETVRKIKARAVRVARTHPNRPLRKCEFSSGCSAHVVREGVFSARAQAPGLGNIASHVLAIEGGLITGETEWSAAKATIKAWINSAKAPEAQKIWGCAKGADDAYNELNAQPASKVGGWFDYLYMAGGCALGAGVE